MRALNDDDGSSGGRLLLQADATSGVGMIERPVRDLGLKASGNGSWQTPVLDTSLVSMVGFTWRDGVPLPRILVRFRTGTTWSLWLPAPLLRDLPDPKTGEGSGKAGTTLVLAPSLAKPADALQIQVNDNLPPELAVTLLHAARLTGDARIAAVAPRTTAATPHVGRGPRRSARRRPRPSSRPRSTAARTGVRTSPGAAARRATTTRSSRRTSTTARRATATRRPTCPA